MRKIPIFFLLATMIIMLIGCNDNPADIIYSGITAVNTAPLNAFHYFIENGYLESFEPFLESENGQKLYASIPETLWMAISKNGGIYGVNGCELGHLSLREFQIFRLLT